MRHCASSFLSPLLLSIFATRRTYVRLRVSLRQKSKVSNHFLWLFTEFAKIARNFRFAPLAKIARNLLNKINKRTVKQRFTVLF